MSRSNIIKDFVSKKADLDTTLKRLKVILYSIDNKEVIDWVDKELNGYDELEQLPNYRIFECEVYGDYFSGNAFNHIRATHHLIPLSGLEKSVRDSIKQINIFNDIDTIQKSINSNEKMGKPLPPEICTLISNTCNLAITRATVIIDNSQLMSIIKNVENKTLDILLKLEKEFGNLDELDVNIDGYETEELKTFNQNLFTLIFDHSTSIGNDNKIEKSNFQS